MTDWNKLAADWERLTGRPISDPARTCNCVGPQAGKPLCPCRMRNITTVGGRYVEIIDRGPVKEAI